MAAGPASGDLLGRGSERRRLCAAGCTERVERLDETEAMASDFAAVADGRAGHFRLRPSGRNRSRNSSSAGLAGRFRRVYCVFQAGATGRFRCRWRFCAGTHRQAKFVLLFRHNQPVARPARWLVQCATDAGMPADRLGRKPAVGYGHWVTKNEQTWTY